MLGGNASDGVGDCMGINRNSPVDAPGLASGVVAVDIGIRRICALRERGAVKCRSWNAFGQLGGSTATDRNTPTDVRWLAGTPAYVSAGIDYTCAIMRLGNLRGWGNNEFSQLGDGTVALRYTPVGVLELPSKVLPRRDIARPAR
jgi:alpha-tubulin suppressor-like RCC1 family protein